MVKKYYFLGLSQVQTDDVTVTQKYPVFSPHVSDNT